MRNRLLVLFVSLLLTACSIGPDYVRPTIATQPQWRLDYEAAAGLADAAWWERFEDPALNDLIHTALKENLDLMTATARVDQYLGQLQTTRAEFFPQIGASGLRVAPGSERTRSTRSRAITARKTTTRGRSTPPGRSTCGGASAAPTRRPAPRCWPARRLAGRSC